MDPNANLEEQRRLSKQLSEWADNEDAPDFTDLCQATFRLAELSQALDEWLANGGALPTAWARLENGDEAGV